MWVGVALASAGWAAGRTAAVPKGPQMKRSFLRTLVGASTLLAALTLGSATASAASAPPPGSCPAVQVRSAEVVRTTTGPGMPHADTVLRLEAEQVDYVQAPAYWNYTVVGCGGTGPVVRTPFTTTFPAPGHPIGTCGIAVHGIELNLTEAGDCPISS